jgi:hypothetical protein
MEVVAAQGVFLQLVPFFTEEGLKTVIVDSLLEAALVNEGQFIVGNTEQVSLMALNRPPELPHVKVDGVT